MVLVKKISLAIIIIAVVIAISFIIYPPTPSPTPSSTPTHAFNYVVHFTPDSQVEYFLIDLIDDADTSIHAAFYDFDLTKVWMLFLKPMIEA